MVPLLRVVALLLLALAVLGAAQAPGPASRTAPVLAPQVAGLAWAADEHLLINNNGLLARFDLHSNEEELLDDTVIAFALHPAGKILAVATPDEVSLRSYPDFDWLTALPLHEHASPETSGAPAALDTVQALAWSADGETLAGGTASGHVLLWDVQVTAPDAGLPAEASAEAGELWADLEVSPAAAVAQLSFSAQTGVGLHADGQRLLAHFEDARAVLWDLERREELQRFTPTPVKEGEPATEASAMLLSPDGRRLLHSWTRGAESEMSLLDVEGKILWRRAGLGVEFTPDGAAVLALVPPYRIAALYRAENAAALRVFEPPEGVERLLAVRLNPAGTKLAGVTQSRLGQGLVVWDAATARILKTRR